MTDNELAVTLIKHVTKRIDEFLDETPAAEFADESHVILAFARYLEAEKK